MHINKNILTLKIPTVLLHSKAPYVNQTKNKIKSVLNVFGTSNNARRLKQPNHTGKQLLLKFER